MCGVDEEPLLSRRASIAIVGPVCAPPPCTHGNGCSAAVWDHDAVMWLETHLGCSWRDHGDGCVAIFEAIRRGALEDVMTAASKMRPTEPVDASLGDAPVLRSAAQERLIDEPIVGVEAAAAALGKSRSTIERRLHERDDATLPPESRPIRWGTDKRARMEWRSRAHLELWWQVVHSPRARAAAQPVLPAPRAARPSRRERRPGAPGQALDDMLKQLSKRQ